MIDAISLEGKIIVITEDDCGNIYAIKADSLEEILNDWKGQKEFVPEDDSRIFVAIKYGNKINGINTFGQLMKELTK